MARRLLLALAVLVLLVAGGGVAAARDVPRLVAGRPSAVSGTEASAVFTIGTHRVRQVRYEDGGRLRYTFAVTNPGRLPLTVHGLAAGQPRSRLFTPIALTGPGGASTVRIGAGATERVTLVLRMGGCETLSARAGAFVDTVRVRTERAGLFGDDVVVRLPEEVHTGSPREAFCPRSTATSRPPG